MQPKQLGQWRWPPPNLNGRLEIHDITFPSLRGNPLGDPDTRPVPVYYPPGYDRENKKYPVVIALSGALGTSLTMLNMEPLSPNIVDRADRLIAEGLAPFLLAIPDGFTRYGASQYINSTATGRYEDAMAKDFISWIDRNLRALPGKAVLGKSSGGYGAFILGMKHPDIFQALACHSGDMLFEWCYRPDFRESLHTLQKSGGTEKFLRHIWNQETLTRQDAATLNIVAMASCYGPNPKSPLGFDLPFDLETSMLRDAVWKKWLKHDPIYLMEKYRSNLKKLKLLFIDSGDKDEFFMHLGARAMARRLKKLGVKHQYGEFSGGHFKTAFRYSASLPLLVRALGKH